MPGHVKRIFELINYHNVCVLYLPFCACNVNGTLTSWIVLVSIGNCREILGVANQLIGFAFFRLVAGGILF